MQTVKIMKTVFVKVKVSDKDMPLPQWIAAISYTTWKLIIRICFFLIILSFLAFFVFYFRFYQASLNEESFTNQINCTTSDTQTNTRLCNNQQEKNCQLITGDCSISDHLQNITLYSTW